MLDPEGGGEYMEPQRAGALRIETSQSGVLANGVTQAARPVRRAKRDDVVLPPLDGLTRLEAANIDFEADPLHSEIHRLPQNLLGAGRRPEAHRLLPTLQPHRPEQPDNPEKVIRMQMGEEDLVEREAGPVAHHLPLRPLAAIEHQQLPLALHRQGADVAADGGTGGGGT